MAESSLVPATKDDFEALIDLLAEDDETGLVQPMTPYAYTEQVTPVQRVQVSLSSARLNSENELMADVVRR